MALDHNNLDRETPVKGWVVKNGFWGRIMTFLVVFGPGLIVMEADNDAGAVATYTQAGAQYGTHLMWLLLLLLPITYFVQEMVVRLGIATGQGHAAMIYKRFGRRWGNFSMFDLQLVNFLTLVTEFAAIALVSDRMGIPPVIGVPVSAIALSFLVMTGSYRRWERMVVFLCLLDLAWIVLAFLFAPSVGSIVKETFMPSLPIGGLSSDYLFLVIGIVGTTIAPWQLFFQQNCIADKRLRYADLKASRTDTLVGACMTIAIAGCMMLVGNAMHRHGIVFTDPAQMANELGHLAGPVVRWTIFLLMINASILGTTAISLSSAWAFGDVLGWSHGLNIKPKDAPGFYVAFLVCVLVAGGIVLIPRAPLQLIILSVQVLSGVVLPWALVLLQILLNDKEMLDEKFVNRPWNNVINWSIIGLMLVLSALMALQVMQPDVFHDIIG